MNPNKSTPQPSPVAAAAYAAQAPAVATRKEGSSSDSVKIQDAVQPMQQAFDGKGVEIDTERVFSSSQLDEEAFLRDIVHVFVADPQNENEPQFVEVTVNGDYILIPRGIEVKMRRYHLAVLAQAKQARVRQRKVVNQDGSMGFVEETVLALTYPFQVTHDPNLRRGSPWLKQLLGNPG